MCRAATGPHRGQASTGSESDALFEPNAYRSSDHDPVLVGLQLSPPTPTPRVKADCRRGGWRSLFRPDGSAFRNQGQCIRYVNTGR